MAQKRSSGSAEINVMPADRQIERSKGCWNCMKWKNEEEARKRWKVGRQTVLAQALEVSLRHPEGEECQAVKEIRQNVDKMDHLIASGTYGICKHHEPFVPHNYLCNKWVGKTGASVAEGANDELPEELKARLN